MAKTSILKASTAIFGTALFLVSAFYMYVSFRWQEIASILFQVNLWWLLLGGGLSIIVYWILRTIRWQILLRRIGIQISFSELYMCTAASLTVALFTPLQSGEMLKVEFLKKRSLMGRTQGYSSCLIERLLDLISVLAIACFSIMLTLQTVIGRTYAYAILAVLVVLCAAGAFALKKFKGKGRIGDFAANMKACVQDTKTLMCVVALTMLCWIIITVSWQIFLASISIDLGFTNTMALMSIISLVKVLSLVPGGFGVSEVGNAQMLIFFGQSAPAAQAGSIILRCYSLSCIMLVLLQMVIWKFSKYRRAEHTPAANCSCCESLLPEANDAKTDQ
ncbi:MAG: lysylphosphatidylglycerol synthase transmembrane domain-containing protein [Armatimonadota bacterium]